MRCIAITLALLFLLHVTVDAAAQSAPSQPTPSPSPSPSTIAITVLVRDASTRAGIPHVHVRLESNTRAYDGFTDRGGTAHFTGIVPDNYIVSVQQKGYSFPRERLIRIEHDGAQFAYDGTRTAPQLIGSVATATKRPSPDTVSADNPSADLSGSVLGNPYSIPNLGIGANGGLRIGAQGPSTTTALIDGAPVFPSGATIPTGLLGGDFFGGASDVPSTPGSPGGALGLNTFDPTLDWQGFLEARPTSYGGDTWGIRERGTSGNIGISFTHAERDVATSPLNDDFYADTSGRAYDHDFLTALSGDALKLRAPLSDNSVITAEGTDFTYVTPQTCTFLDGDLPCGYGPGNRTAITFTTGILEYDQTFSQAKLKTKLFVSNTTSNIDEGGELFLGTAIGFNDSIVTRRIGAQTTADVNISRQRQVTLTVLATHDVSTVNQQIATPAQPVPPDATSFFSAKLTAQLLTLKRLSADASEAFEHSDGLGKLETDLQANYRFNSHSDVNVFAQANALGSPIYGSDAVGQASSLQFDCNGRALGQGPIVGGLPPSQTSVSVGYTYNVSPFEASLTAKEITTRNAQISSAIVPGTAIGAGLFSTGFFSSASTSAGTICGTPQALDPSATAFTVGGIAQTSLEDRITGEAHTQIGSRISVQGTYTLDFARAYGFDSILASAINVTPGAQLPVTPRETANATFAYAVSKYVSLESDITAFGSGSIYSRSGFAAINSGVKANVGSGDLIVGVENVDNAAAPNFTRFAPYPFSPQGYPPRTYSVQYRLAFGNSYEDRTNVLNPPITAGNTNLVYLVPTDFEGADHPDFLALDKTSPYCGPERVPRAKVILADLRAYAAYVEKQRAAGLAATPQTIDDISFSTVPARIAYTIRISLAHSIKAAAPLLECGRIHDGDVTAAEKLGVFVPDATTRYEDSYSVVYYAPQAGLYFAPEAADQTSLPTTVLPFPSRIPIERVAISETTCPATYRSAVGDVLAELKSAIPAYYGGHAPAALPRDFRIGAHTAKGGTWLEIAFDDYALANAVRSCLGARNATAKQLATEGIGATQNFASINYAPAVGLYTNLGF
jgi:hypothetical protein